MNRWHAILWDLDGTLLDTAPDLVAAVHALCRRHQRAAPPFERLRPFASQGARGLLRETFGVEPQQPEYEALREEFLAHYAANIAVRTRLFPGVADCLATLAEHDIPWGIVTNKPGYLTDALLAALPLPLAPAVVVSGDTTARCKPDPLPLLYALERLAVSPQRSLYLGDDRRDIEAAHAASCAAWAAGWGYCSGEAAASWGADAVIPRSEDLAARLFAEAIGGDGPW
ncbi:MAG: HAD family hydrolase [Acidithiobacillus sp.]